MISVRLGDSSRTPAQNGIGNLGITIDLSLLPSHRKAVLIHADARFRSRTFGGMVKTNNGLDTTALGPFSFRIRIRPLFLRRVVFVVR